MWSGGQRARAATRTFVLITPAASPSPAPSAQGPLGGPRVETHDAGVGSGGGGGGASGGGAGGASGGGGGGVMAARLSIVHRGADGRLERVESHPAESAVTLLPLDAAAQSRVQEVMVERAAAFDAIVRQNLLDIAALGAAAQAGQQDQVMASLRTLGPKLAPLMRPGAYERALGDALNAEQRAQLEAMVNEYLQAVLDENAADAAAMAGEGPAPAAGPRGGQARGGLGRGRGGGALLGPHAQEMRRVLGEEIKAAYSRVIGQRVKEFDGFLSDLALEPQTEGRVRQIFMDVFTRNNGKENRADIMLALVEVNAIISPEERQRLRRALAERYGPARSEP
ncbi:MAG: hypothetical protein C0475_07615 [Planctomyces sp.]|nr:hypothetical protein [Planctomyces sp.]